MEFLILIVVAFIFYYFLHETYKYKIGILQKRHQEEEQKLKFENERRDKEFKNREDIFKKTIESTRPFSKVSELYSDWCTVVFDIAEQHLKFKNRPAYKAAEVVSEMKENARDALKNYKEMRYKYLFLLDAFPELKRYVDDEEALKHLSDYKDYNEFKSERDEVLDWISSDEYQKMSETERNQLALDRYKRAVKSDWQIGMQYEMYIGYLLREKDYRVIQYGIEHGLNDLGRDIIAQKEENGILYTYIIQCKNWSNHRTVNENVICQLFGTAIQYKITHPGLFSTVKPWLIITNHLSETARKFARELKVVVNVIPLGDFPMIKCNINNGNKIYHLPFDQQYYRTKIDKPGEFYAWTVKDAVGAGFRRARKHLFNK